MYCVSSPTSVVPISSASSVQPDFSVCAELFSSPHAKNPEFPEVIVDRNEVGWVVTVVALTLLFDWTIAPEPSVPDVLTFPSDWSIDHEQRPGMGAENVIVTVPLDGLATMPRNWNMSARSVPAVSMDWFSNCTQVTPLPDTDGADMFTL